jgi:hypothetical protein
MIDGVIKYHVSHSQGEAPDCTGYAELEALRARLFALEKRGRYPFLRYLDLARHDIL